MSACNCLVLPMDGDTRIMVFVELFSRNIIKLWSLPPSEMLYSIKSTRAVISQGGGGVELKAQHGNGSMERKNY